MPLKYDLVSKVIFILVFKVVSQVYVFKVTNILVPSKKKDEIY